MTKEITPEGITQLGLGFWGSKTLLSAIEIDLFAELAKGSLDANTIACRLGLHQRSIRDFLDALVALHMLEREHALGLLMSLNMLRDSRRIRFHRRRLPGLDD